MSYLPSKETDNYGNYHWKVGNANVSNNIPQMRSEGFQPYFCAGGSNAVPYYLGFQGNISERPLSKTTHSEYKRVVNHLKGGGLIDELAKIGDNKLLMDNLIKEGTTIGNPFKGIVGFNPFEIGMRIGEPIGHYIGGRHYSKKRRQGGKGLQCGSGILENIRRLEQSEKSKKPDGVLSNWFEKERNIQKRSDAEKIRKVRTSEKYRNLSPEERERVEELLSKPYLGLEDMRYIASFYGPVRF